MDLKPDGTTRGVSFVFVVLGLVALAAGLLAMLFIAIQGASEIPDPPAQKFLLRLAWLSLLLLGMTLVLLVWAIRWMVSRMAQVAGESPTNSGSARVRRIWARSS